MTLYVPQLDDRPVSHVGRTANGKVTTAPLVLRNVSKRWQNDRPPVLDDVSLTLEPGTSNWVGGRNGVGKTTLLRIAAGLIDPDHGRAEAWGATVRENRVRYQRLVAFLPAGDRGLYARLTVRRHLEFSAGLSMMPRDRIRRRVEDTIATFELKGLADRRVDRMSMGQRQRLRIAMAFLARPDVVLLDEPLTSLDENGVALLEAAIQGLLARDGAALWCSPTGANLDMAFGAYFTLDQGRLKAA
jgi:ABC-2 type transport system ATP-binding protein